MSTPLEQNTSTLEAILEAVNNLPDAGSGGSGGVETCTVTVTSFANNIKLAIYSTYENGEYKYNDISYDYSDSSHPNSITLNNVICGSQVEVSTSYSFCGWIHNVEDFSYINPQSHRVVCAPIVDTSLEIIDDD